MVPSQLADSSVVPGGDANQVEDDFNQPICSASNGLLSGYPFVSPLPNQQPYRHSTTGKPKLGTYEIDKTIGKGIFSVVKLATHTITGITLAIKLIDKTRLDAENLIKIYRESEILKKLHHPNIVKLYQVMETPRLLCLVMEYLPNGEVFDYIATHGRFSESQARVKFMDVLCAVDYTHSCGIVHRDLKAENLLFDSDMNIRLIDFSFGTHHSESSTQLLTTWCGSPPYAAPEIFKGEPYVGTKADIWSLGVVLYVMVCGTLPFDAQPLPHLKKQVLSASFRVPYWLSLSCERLIRSMLAKVPDKRPSTRELFKHPWLTEYSVQFPPPSSTTRDDSSTSCALPVPQTITSDPDQDQQLCSKPIIVPPEKRVILEPGSDLAADVEMGKVNEFVILIMESYGMKRSQILESLSRKAYDHLMATYLLLGEKVRRHRYSLQLPVAPGRHLMTSSMPTKMKPPSPPGRLTRELCAKQSRVDSAVDMKSLISESDSTSSLSVAVSDSEKGTALRYLTSGMWTNEQRVRVSDSPVQGTFSFDEQARLMHNQITITGIPTTSIDSSLQPEAFVCDTQLEPSFEDTLITAFEPNKPLVFKPKDQTNQPWLVGTSDATIENNEVASKSPLRRTLVRRKYGVFDPPAELDRLAQTILAEQYNTERNPLSDQQSYPIDDD